MTNVDDDFKVCILGLHVNKRQIFVGKDNNLSNFSFDNDGLVCRSDKMITPLLTIQDGKVISSICKGLIIFVILKFLDFIIFKV